MSCWNLYVGVFVGVCLLFLSCWISFNMFNAGKVYGFFLFKSSRLRDVVLSRYRDVNSQFFVDICKHTTFFCSSSPIHVGHQSSRVGIPDWC